MAPKPAFFRAWCGAIWVVALIAQGAVFAQPSQTLVAQGRYLAAIGNCASCHTRAGGPAFGGGVAFHVAGGWFREPIGTVYSSNISPDPETGIGGWTLADFSRAMREGISKNGDHLYPVFPYPAFGGLAQADMAALFAYVMSVQPVHFRPPDNDLPFPLNRRWSLIFWKWLYARPQPYQPDGDRSLEWNRGAYLVQALGHCGACHSPRNLLLAEISERALSGGSHFDAVQPGKVREWAAVNLTSAPTGLGAWSKADIASYLTIGHSAKAGRFGPMDTVIANGTQQLTQADAGAVAEFLKSLGPIESGAGQALDAEQRDLGLAVYIEHCEDCHMQSGRGNFFKSPPLAGSAVVQAPGPWSLINIVLYGAGLPAGVPPPYSAWEDMVAYRDKLSDLEIAAVSNYLRTAWDNKGEAVTAEDVARQR